MSFFDSTNNNCNEYHAVYEASGLNSLDSVLKYIIKVANKFLEDRRLKKIDLYKNNPASIIFKFYNDEEKNSDEVYVTIIKDKKFEQDDTHNAHDYSWDGTGVLKYIDSDGIVKSSNINFITKNIAFYLEDSLKQLYEEKADEINIKILI